MLYSTSFFAPIPYFQSIAKHKAIVIDLYELYKKQTWRNRAQILESNGPMYLTVPVIRPNGSQSIVKEVKVCYKTDWRKDHWMAIISSYQHAPYFFYYGEQIRELIYHEEPILYKYNDTIFRQLLKWLDLDIEVSFSEQYHSPIDKSDYRISLDKKNFDIEQERYIQVFSDKMPFYPNLSILDLLLNEGPLARKRLTSNKQEIK